MTILLAVSLWLMLGTCNSTALMKRLLPGHPSPDYTPTFPWENFFKKSNEVSSSEYVDAYDMTDMGLNADGTEIRDHGYDPNDLYAYLNENDPTDEPNLEGTGENVVNDYIPNKTIVDDDDKDIDNIDDSNIDASIIVDTDIDDSDIDDPDMEGSEIDIPGNHNHDHIHSSVFDDGYIDDTNHDINDADNNLISKDGDDLDREFLSDHLIDLPFEDNYPEEAHVSDHSSENSEEPLDRDPRALKFIPRLIMTGAAAWKGKRARATILKGTIQTRHHGITRHYDKAGGKEAMLKDFYFVQPTKVSDDLIDGHYVGKIGQVGDTRLHYFLHDAEHVELKPILSIQKIDGNGNIVAKDIIHYID